MFLAPQWDTDLLASWRRTRNPRAVLSTYAPPPQTLWMTSNQENQGKEREGDTNNNDFDGGSGETVIPHICRSRFTMEGLPTI